MRWHRPAPGLIVALIAVGLGGELFARYALGLGDPPLTIRDPEIDYLFKPGTYHRFGNTITYNSFSMRADEVPPTKQGPDELRILVFGDSVVNGGAHTDDSELATRLAQEALADRLQRPVWIGNVSAGSWGPGNHLAYIDRFGLFDADIVIFLLSSHDIDDVPDFQADLGLDFPLEPPPLALQEAVVRYLPRYLPSIGSADAGVVHEPFDARIDEGRELFRELLRRTDLEARHVVVLHHLEQAEVTGEPAERAALLARRAALLQEDAESEDATLLRLRPFVDTAPDAADHFRDAIHITAAGQRHYAAAIICVVERAQDLPGDTCA